jgi:hypothetical protein
MIWNTGMHLRCRLFSFGLISSFIAGGCGSGETPPESLVMVAGTVLVDGKPMDGVQVTFIPEIAKNNRGGIGTTSADGSFTVTDLTQNLPGLAPGKYAVAYSRMRLPDGSAIPEPVAGQPPNPGIIRVETLPTYLQSPDPRDPSRLAEIPVDGIVDMELGIKVK